MSQHMRSSVACSQWHFLQRSLGHLQDELLCSAQPILDQYKREELHCPCLLCHIYSFTVWKINTFQRKISGFKSALIIPWGSLENVHPDLDINLLDFCTLRKDGCQGCDLSTERDLSLLQLDRFIAGREWQFKWEISRHLPKFSPHLHHCNSSCIVQQLENSVVGMRAASYHIDLKYYKILQEKIVKHYHFFFAVRNLKENSK